MKKILLITFLVFAFVPATFLQARPLTEIEKMNIETRAIFSSPLVKTEIPLGLSFHSMEKLSDSIYQVIFRDHNGLFCKYLIEMDSGYRLMPGDPSRARYMYRADVIAINKDGSCTELLNR